MLMSLVHHFKIIWKVPRGNWFLSLSETCLFLPRSDIIVRHASDASSSAVRAAAVNAVTILLEEGKTHAVLRSLLPSVGNLIHDKVQKVRLAVVHMLLVIKRLRGIKYYNVVRVQKS